jgi:sec-independent protein translocase protein TatC
VTQTENNPESENTEAGFITHLLELRDRLLRSVIVLTIIFAVLFPFANEIYHFLATPLLAHMPIGSSMIAVEVISPFLTPLKMALYAAVLVGMPYLLFQAWSFVAPGLYQHEKRLATPLLISSIVLFYAGIAFAYFVVFPLVFNFLINVAPEGVAVMTDINKYLDFVLALFFAFGLAFEVPVATIILIAMGVTTAESLTEKRPYIIVGAFVLGMLLTPPDIISQIMLALPMWFLFECGIIMSRILIKPSEDEEDEEGTTSNSRDTYRAAAASAGAAAAAQTSNASTAPRGYTAPAYPDDYKPLTWEEMEAEIDEAAKWEDEGEDEDEDVAHDDSDRKDEEESGEQDPADAETETEDGYVKRDDDEGP